MLIFFAEGRLGNQLFQYSFLQTIRQKNEILLTSGFEEIEKYFEHDHFVNLSRNVRFTRIFMYEFLRRMVTFLSKMRLITLLKVKREVIDGLDRETRDVQTKRGIFSGIKYVEAGYFQSHQFFTTKVSKKIILKREYARAATSFLAHLPKDVYPVFVHIRRGDYRSFTMSGRSTYLPLRYYKECIEWFLKHKNNPYFIFLSDEPQTIERDFTETKNKVVSYNNAGVDMGIMMNCKGAILSPSSFGWWGSFFMKNKDVVFAPRYWLGFNFNVECHVDSTPPYAKIVKV